MPLPGEVVEQTQHILEGIVPGRLVAAALSGAGQVVSEKAGHLAGQARVHSLGGATLVKERESLVRQGEASLKVSGSLSLFYLLAPTPKVTNLTKQFRAGGRYSFFLNRSKSGVLEGKWGWGWGCGARALTWPYI